MAGLLSVVMALATSAVEAGKSPELHIQLGLVLLVIYILTGGGKLVFFSEQLLNLYQQFCDVKVAKSSEKQMLKLAKLEVDKVSLEQSKDPNNTVSMNRD